ncbi:MAG TPA: hypothetical protein VF876_13510, partial [Burkholderiales bacterium]
AGLVTEPYHALVPSFGEWGYVLASAHPLQARRPLPEGLRFLNREALRKSRGGALRPERGAG